MTVRRADSEISTGNGRTCQPASLTEMKEANAKELPFLKFFPSDHLSDPQLGVCSLAARGLYMGILCLMHLARPYGHLLVAGRAPEPEEIARLARCTIEEVEALLLELENNQVFRRTPMGVLVSPRLLQDEAARQQHIQNGKKGGNPVLIGDRINKGNADLALEGAEREHQRRERAAERQRRHRAKKKELGHVMSRDVASFSVTRHVTLHGGNSVKAAPPERDTSTKDAGTSWFVTEVKGGRCVAGSMDVTGDKAQKPESRILDKPVTVALGHMRVRRH